MSMKYIGLLPQDLVDYFFEQLVELLTSAVAYGNGECRVEDIFHLVATGRMHLLVEIEAGRVKTVLALEPVTYPQQIALNIAYGAGQAVSRLLPRVIEVARAVGASAIETKTRPSVARLFQKVGFETSYVVSRMEL